MRTEKTNGANMDMQIKRMLAVNHSYTITIDECIRWLMRLARASLVVVN